MIKLQIILQYYIVNTKLFNMHLHRFLRVLVIGYNLLIYLHLRRANFTWKRLW